eukprot:evm.model.scf_256EXC.8 EVM.evm.TU.scf_256EXC.8   scf_256EXC:81972-83503(+)
MACPFVAGVVAQYLEGNRGASPAEVLQVLMAASADGRIEDDPSGRATLHPALKPGLLDISTTPNRVLCSRLLSQAAFDPGVVILGPNIGPVPVDVRLAFQPDSDVHMTFVVDAAWDGRPLASMSLVDATFRPHEFDSPMRVFITPENATGGRFYVNVKFQCVPSAN